MCLSTENRRSGLRFFYLLSLFVSASGTIKATDKNPSSMGASGIFRYQRSARRAAQITLLIAFVTQLASCGTTTNLSSEEKLREDLASFTVASETSQQTVYEFPSGTYSISVMATLSNGDKKDWHVDKLTVPPNGRFLVFAFEVGHGLVPATVTTHPTVDPPKPTKVTADPTVDPPKPANWLLSELTTGWGEALFQAAGPLIIMTAPVWGMAYLMTREPDHEIEDLDHQPEDPGHKREAPDHIPGELVHKHGKNCCLVWIEDANSGDYYNLLPAEPHTSRQKK